MLKRSCEEMINILHFGLQTYNLLSPEMIIADKKKEKKTHHKVAFVLVALCRS